MDKLGIGRKMERLAMYQWARYGFRCWQPPRSKYAGQDGFGIWDFEAVHPDGRLHWVQVKRWNAREVQRARDAVEAFLRDFPIPVGFYMVSWRKRRNCILMRSERLSSDYIWEPCADWYAEP